MKTDRSTVLFQNSQKVIPCGVNSPVRACKAVGTLPRFIHRAEGCRLFDADDNAYIDYVGSWGPMILGHRHPAVHGHHGRHLGLDQGRGQSAEGAGDAAAGGVATGQKDQAQAAISVAEAAVDVAKVNMGYTKVYAPISGRISRSFVTEGTLVTTNQAQQLATITQLDPVYIDMQESGSSIITLRQSMRKQGSMDVEVTVDEVTGERYDQTGSVKFSEVTVDETTGSVTLRAEMPNPDGVLLPGLFVKGHVITGRENALLVPQRATTRQPDG